MRDGAGGDLQGPSERVWAVWGWGMLCKAMSKVHQDGQSCKTSASAQIRCLQTHSVTVAAASALPCCQARCRTCLLDPPCSCEYATIRWMLVAVKNNRHITVQAATCHTCCSSPAYTMPCPLCAVSWAPVLPPSCGCGCTAAAWPPAHPPCWRCALTTGTTCSAM